MNCKQVHPQRKYSYQQDIDAATSMGGCDGYDFISITAYCTSVTGEKTRI
jgi:hypothetical protein